MKRIVMKTVLVIFLFCISCTYTFSDTYFFSIIDYLNLALENNIKLKIAKLSYLKEQALTNLQMEVLKPQLSVNSDPLYGFSNSRLFNVEIFLAIRGLYNLNCSAIYNLFS